MTQEAFHVVNVKGVNFMVDLGVRTHLEAVMEGERRTVTVTFEDIQGSEITCFVSDLVIWSSDPAIREENRKHDMMINREVQAFNLEHGITD